MAEREAPPQTPSGDANWWEQSIDPEEAAVDSTIGIAVGTLIGKYRVIGTLGAGGMGEVVLADRADDTFSQRVAIKLVKAGLVSNQVQSRLKIERQILATLDHPNIAKLLDGGTTLAATPYIVMEYIDGIPIDAYCDRHKLTLHQRLALFQTVCSAVHYAHQNLVVHRDLKPSNILVTPEGVPKLLDFGIAKVLDNRQVLHTVAVTHADIRLMTPDHASPEQVRGDPITTASDIYVLGVLLYELLTGRKPYAFKTGRLSEIERVICEEAPLPLAQGLTDHISEVDAEGRKICENRSITPSRLRRELRGDLSNIVQTALRKEPERRYPSAEQFAADIGRFMAERPIIARRDTWRYRTRMFVTRYRYGVAAAAAALLALVAFTFYTIAQSERIARERTKAEQVSSFLVELFERADPTHSRGDQMTVREMLDIGSRRIESGLATQPEVRANLLGTMGTVYGSLGIYDESVELLDESLQSRLKLYGAEHLEVAEAMQQLGSVFVRRGDYDRAEMLLEEALTINRNLAGRNKLRIAASLQELANLRRSQERFSEADRLFREALDTLDESGTDSQLKRIQILNDYGLLLDYTGNQAGAEQSYRRAMELGERTLGAIHPDIADISHNLADTLSKQGRVAEAGPLFLHSLDLYRKLLGENHPFTAMALANYGRFLQQSGDFIAAESTLREALKLDEEIRGREHMMVGYDHHLLGHMFLEQGQAAVAAAEFRTAIDIYSKSLPGNHLYFGAARAGLGRSLVELGQARAGEDELRKALGIFQSALGTDNSMVGIIAAGLGRSLAAQRRFTEAEPLLRKGYVAAFRSRGAADGSTIIIRKWLETLYQELGNPEAATIFFAETAARSAPVETTIDAPRR